MDLQRTRLEEENMKLMADNESILVAKAGDNHSPNELFTSKAFSESDEEAKRNYYRTIP